MIKKTLYFGNPAYLSLRNAQLVIKLPGVESGIVTRYDESSGRGNKTY